MTKQKYNMTVKIVTGIMLGIFLLAFSENSRSDSIYGLTNDDLSTIIEKANESFDLAEKEIFKIDPKPDDVPVGPHPDADKCICGGSGKITHGDGHQTDCPYHGKKEVPILKEQIEECTPQQYEQRRIGIFNFFRRR